MARPRRPALFLAWRAPAALLPGAASATGSVAGAFASSSSLSLALRPFLPFLGAMLHNNSALTSPHQATSGSSRDFPPGRVKVDTNANRHTQAERLVLFLCSSSAWRAVPPPETPRGPGLWNAQGHSVCADPCDMAGCCQTRNLQCRGTSLELAWSMTTSIGSSSLTPGSHPSAKLQPRLLAALDGRIRAPQRPHRH